MQISKKDMCYGDLPLNEMSKGKSAGIQDAGQRAVDGPSHTEKGREAGPLGSVRLQELESSSGYLRWQEFME